MTTTAKRRRVSRRFDQDTGLWWCPGCREHLPRDRFYGADPGKPSSRCKTHHARASSEWNARCKETDPERIRATDRRYEATPMGRWRRAKAKARYYAAHNKTPEARERQRAVVAFCEEQIRKLRAATPQTG